MTRSLSLVVVGAFGIARADTVPVTPSAAPAIDAKLAATLKRGGWADPTIAHRSPRLTVVSALKGKVRHFVIASPAGAIIDGGVAPANVTLAEGSVAIADLIELQISTRTPRANQGYAEATQIWLIRENGTIACNLEGSSSTNTGTACGSGGWTEVSLRGGPGAHATKTIDVIIRHSGTLSEADGKGGCRYRSPVRSGPIRSRYSIGAKGTCKQVAVPASATTDETL